MPAINKTQVITAADFQASKGRKSAVKDGRQQMTDDYLARLAGRVANLVIIAHEPMGAPRMVQSDKWKGREVVLRYFALKDAVRAACLAQNYQMGGVLTIRFELSMPKSWSQKKRDQMRGKPHQQKPDIDNMGKAVADSFNEDDSHVHTMILSKVWADIGRIIITP
jgi:Holliday junction resolvase RusA-like endonuclease